MIYANSATAISVNLQAGTGSGGEAAGDTLTSVEHAYGSNFNDTIIGSDGTINALLGLGGNDYLNALSGNDRLDGGTGDDVLEGGAGFDVFVFGSGYGQDRASDFTDGTDQVDLIGGLTFGDLTLSSVAGGVRAAISSAPDTWIDLIGVSLSDVTSADFF